MKVNPIVTPSKDLPDRGCRSLHLHTIVLESPRPTTGGKALDGSAAWYAQHRSFRSVHKRPPIFCYSHAFSPLFAGWSGRDTGVGTGCRPDPNYAELSSGIEEEMNVHGRVV